MLCTNNFYFWHNKIQQILKFSVSGLKKQKKKKKINKLIDAQRVFHHFSFRKKIIVSSIIKNERALDI